MWYLTLLCGFWVLFSTQLGGVDGVPRRYTDIIWTGFKRARKMKEHNAKWIYYPILIVYILWGVIAMYLAKPFFMIIVSATVGGYLLVITSLHTLYPTLRTCFDTFWYFYDKPVSRKDSHRIGEIWSCELRFYFPLVFFLVHLKLLTQCRDHAGLRNKYRNRKSEVRSIGSM